MNGEKQITWEWRAGYDYATAKYKAEIDRLRYEAERWKHVAENKWGIDDLQKYQAEIDRLRAELAQAEKDHTELTGAYENASVEAERLRAENANLHEQLDTVSEAHNVMAKEGDRLQAENAMARVFFQAILDSGQRGYPADLAIEFLAKTAKEGE